MKPQHLADKSGLQKSLIHYVERGEERSNTSIEKLGQLAKGLGVPAFFLFLDNSFLERTHPEEVLEWYELLCDLDEKNKAKAIEYMKDLLKSQQK